MAGFHARGSDVIVPVPNCKLLHPDLMALLPAVDGLVQVGGSRSQELSVTLTRTLSGPDVQVNGGKPLDAALRMELARLVERLGLARLTWGDETVALRTVPETAFGGVKVALPPAAFLQATAEGEAALLALVRRALGAQDRVVDLFAGLGTFSLPLAREAEVAAYEGESALVTALDRAVRNAQGLKRVCVEKRDLFRRPLEPDELQGLTGVVIDPPRAGAEAQAARLAASAVPVIAMVSCNPASFARDARILCAGGYRLDWVVVVDQFRGRIMLNWSRASNGPDDASVRNLLGPQSGKTGGNPLCVPEKNTGGSGYAGSQTDRRPLHGILDCVLWATL